MNKKNDGRLKILSVIVAIAMWTFVTNSTNPSVSKTFRALPVVIKNQDALDEAGYTIIGADENYQANVKLKGTRERVAGLRPENIYASIDISDVKEGVQSFPIEVDTPTAVTVDEVEPGEVTLNIQRIVEKKLPVNLIISEEIKDGRIVEVNDLSPAEITVRGPAGLINTVDRAEARIDNIDLVDGKIHNVPLQIIDKDNNLIEKIDASSDDINVSFFVSLTKTVPIKMFTSGSIDSSYEETSRQISPETVVLKGPESIMREIEEVSTKPININNLKTSKQGEIKLDLPESVEVYNGENVVTYRIDLKRKPTTKTTTKEKTEDQTNE